MAALDAYTERKAAAIAARRADYTAQPGKSVATLHASSRVAGITGARPTQMGDHRIISDSGAGLAGFALGPTAPEILLGALASCLVHTYLIHATLLQIPLDDVQISISGELDYAGVIGMETASENTAPIALQNITYRAQIASPADPDAITRLHAAVEANCPVLNTLRLPVAVTRAE